MVLGCQKFQVRVVRMRSIEFTPHRRTRIACRQLMVPSHEWCSSCAQYPYAYSQNLWFGISLLSLTTVVSIMSMVVLWRMRSTHTRNFWLPGTFRSSHRCSEAGIKSCPATRRWIHGSMRLCLTFSPTVVGFYSIDPLCNRPLFHHQRTVELWQYNENQGLSATIN